MILLGERLPRPRAPTPPPSRSPRTTGARLAWVPRRAGDRGAVEAGCLPNLLPGGRPVADAAARVDVATAWGVDSLPEHAGRDADAIVAAAVAGDLGGLVVGGVDPDDTADPQAFRDALAAASFVVALELRETDVTRAADVVFPVAPVTDKAGTFVTWEGRPRPFEVVLRKPASLPDLRVLAGIAEELGRPPGLPDRRRGAGRRWRTSGPGTASGPPSAARPAVAGARPSRPPGLALSTWKQMLDNGSMQDGDDHLARHRAPGGRQGQPAGLRRRRPDRDR